MESREDFYFDDSDNPGSDDMIEKEEHYKWAVALEEETKEDAFIPEDDLLEQAEPEVAERLILKKDLRKAAIARMEAAARTQGDFEDVIDAWDKEDKNRERRQRYHEVCRDDAEVPFEYNMSPDEIVIPAPIQSVYWHQMMKGEFLDVIFDCPYELQELVCDSNISQILSELSEKHKALFYFLYIRDYSTCCLAKMYEQSDRNIRKVRATILRKIHKKLIPVLQYKCDNGLSTTMKERNFLERHCSTDG